MQENDRYQPKHPLPLKAMPSSGTARRPHWLTGWIDRLALLARLFLRRVLCQLLGTEENGRWLLAPAGEVEKTSRKYRDHTLILETTFETADFAVTLIDFMPIRGHNSDIVRIVKGIRGTAPMRMEMALRFNYGATVPWVTRRDQPSTPLPVPTWWCFNHGADYR